jgi:hypothetical protein
MQQQQHAALFPPLPPPLSLLGVGQATNYRCTGKAIAAAWQGSLLVKKGACVKSRIQEKKKKKKRGK